MGWRRVELISFRCEYCSPGLFDKLEVSAIGTLNTAMGVLHANLSFPYLQITHVYLMSPLY